MAALVHSSTLDIEAFEHIAKVCLGTICIFTGFKGCYGRVNSFRCRRGLATTTVRIQRAVIILDTPANSSRYLILFFNVRRPDLRAAQQMIFAGATIKPIARLTRRAANTEPCMQLGYRHSYPPKAL